MIQTVENKFGIFFNSFSRFDPFLPLIERFWNNVKVSIFEKEANYGFLHICSLLLRFHCEVIVDLLRGIARLYELFSQSLGVSLSLVSFKDDITLSVDEVGQVHSVDVVLPLEEEVLESVLGSMHQSSLKESLFEVLVLTSVLQRVKSRLNSSLEEPIKDLCNAS